MQVIDAFFPYLGMLEICSIFGEVSRMSDFKNLFSPGKIGTMELRNRLIMPAMGSGMQAEDGSVTERLYHYHRVRAAGGTGLITVEIAAVHPTSKGAGLAIYDDKYIPGLRRLVDVIHQGGAKACLQLWHAGRQLNSMVTGMPIVAPSAIPCPLCQEEPKELSVGEIQELVEAYGEAARRAMEAGFDSIELHGAHGYLIAQFMSPYSNKRTDEYGGSLERRARFAREIISSVRSKVGPDYPLLYRFSGEELVEGGLTIEDNKKIAPLLVDAGVDCLHVSVGVYETLRYVVPPMDLERGFNAWAAHEIKKVVSVPVVAVDRINDPYVAEDILAQGQADFIAIGRSLLTEPNWPKLVQEGKYDQMRHCIACNQGCVDRLLLEQKHATCILNPSCGREEEFAFKSVQGKKKVVVIGGGPAGMEAARIARQRGCEVVLFEKSSDLGGQWRLAGIPANKCEIRGDVQWLIKNLYSSGVEVKMNTPATVENVQAQKPDLIILATGAEPTAPQLPGIDLPHVVLAKQALEDPASLGKRVVVVGGGPTGLETAEYLAEQGKEVTVVEVLEDVGLTIGPARKFFLMERLQKFGVDLRIQTRLEKVTPQGVEICCEEKSFIEADNVVLATGVRSIADLEAKLASIAKLEVIGDAKEPRKATEAFYEAQVVARSI